MKKKKILGTSDARPIDPAYFVEDCGISFFVHGLILVKRGLKFLNLKHDFNVSS